MDKKLIKEILDYVEETEVNNDAEWGMGRSLEQIISESETADKEDRDAYMPDFYFELKDTVSTNVWLVIEIDGHEFSDVKVFSDEENAATHADFLLYENPNKISVHDVVVYKEQIN